MNSPDAAEGFDQPRLARLAEGCFDDLRDLTEVTGLFGSNRHVHTRIVTTGTGAAPHQIECQRAGWDEGAGSFIVGGMVEQIAHACAAHRRRTFVLWLVAAIRSPSWPAESTRKKRRATASTAPTSRPRSTS